MKNKVLLFFFAAVCFATTFANNSSPPATKLGTLETINPVNAIATTATFEKCNIVAATAEPMMMTYHRQLQPCQNQFCMPVADYKFGVMQKINEMMLKNQQILGYASLKLNFTDCMINPWNSLTTINGGTNWYRVLKISSVANSSSFMINKEKWQGFNLNRGLVLKCPMNNSLRA